MNDERFAPTDQDRELAKKIMTELISQDRSFFDYGWSSKIIVTATGPLRERAETAESETARLKEALKGARNHMVGLAAYLATCNTKVIIENLETTIAALHVQEKRIDAALIGGTNG